MHETPVYPQDSSAVPPVVPNSVIGDTNQFNGQGYPASYTREVRSETVAKVPAQVPVRARNAITTKFIDLVYFVLIVVESVLALRFLFKLLGANVLNVFVSFIYRITEVFVFPFSGLFGVDTQNVVGVSGYQLEFTTLVAMGIYALLAYIVVRLIDLFR